MNYELRFSLFVSLISDALLEHGGSAHQAFQRADEQGHMEVTMEAVYGKLRPVPISLSNGFLSKGSMRLLELLTPWSARQPLPNGRLQNGRMN